MQTSAPIKQDAAVSLGGGPPSAATARVVVARLSEGAKAMLAQQRPWSELTDRNNFTKPENLNDATIRLRKNLAYFRANYGTFLTVVVVLCMLMNPTSIFVLLFLAAIWVYVFMVRVEAVVVAGRTLSDREKFLALSALSVLVAFGLTSVGSILISGLIIGSAIICVHAAFRVPDDLFTDDQDAGGFLSFLSQSQPGIPASIGQV